jgi:FtsH-binding integral membrane protein
LCLCCTQWTFWTAFGVSLGLVLLLSCWEQARRQHPLNLIFLFAFTACEAVLVGTISTMYNTDIVLIAAVLTVGITLCLSLYALQTKRDFTAAGGILFSLLFALIGAGLLSIFFRNRVMDILVSGVGAALFGCYIVFDVQLMVGSGSYSISPDEYVFAAINIYLVSLDIDKGEQCKVLY